MSRVAENLELVRGRLEAACDRAGRPRDAARLVAVSKRIPDDLLADAFRAGQRLFGENRVQDALPRLEAFPEVLRGRGEDPSGLIWHFIGTLQANKVRKVVGAFDLLHGIDSVRLAERVDRVAGEGGLVQPLLLQVNASEETAKHGLGREGAVDAALAVDALEHVRLDGFMAMARAGAEPEELRRTFAFVRRLAEDVGRLRGRPLPELSLGMSGDFELAVEEGATLVRLGTAVFGPRGS